MRTWRSLALVACAAACTADGPPDAPGVQVRDSAGVTIVENGVLDLDRALLSSTEPVVEIGVVDGPEAYQLFQVTDARRLPDGGFAVANAGSRELRIFEVDGRHRVTVGGAGRGPAEFGFPIAVRVQGADSVLVQDRLDRVWFTADGDFLARAVTDRQDLVELSERVGGRAEGGHWMPDGRLFTPLYARDPSPRAGGHPFRPEMTLVLVSEDLTSVDTLGVFGGIEQQYVDVGEGRPSPMVPPFGTNTSWGVGADDGTVVAGDNAVPQVELFGPDGRRTLVRWTARPVPVTRADVEAWKDARRNTPGIDERLPELERAWLTMDVPETRPYFGTVASGSDGRVWLGPAEEDGSGWLVFGPDGRYEGSAALPAAFRPTDSGPGWVLGVVRDENGVERLQLYGVNDG